ncbi:MULTISPECIES: PdxA family dehydrogenase [Burkholderia]|jgi:4-hydroxy-L-threonine phosphate dehydrogenase PdxA|uniref:PdxA family dehydrogenase n=1 Tax=Burkholderia TaxID=32008 RepID=UPI0006273B3C|nr:MULTISPECIES: 4-hydroxythreonine-4-phosphate dehydrogenase PdxA [Burkholderia]KAF1059178.1 1,2-dihydroxy-3,5-cyclohexadiene-1,4-dicarboxylate dehydrogenase [Burkholderia gladioli]KKJ07693.1 terephthalate dihydrodiol dehydrogenase [Burkholderia gladioli]MBA1363202.1 terephthalate dihydrodiol dehydrogenase [Burkholderia gladioli]MBJ9674231.1 4-hydroxythreonine-4-phosphate dehydrogenase PdxA [Burkholderia gladioli]MBU9552742.1 4-hydroxythreonine-4-phosphate dehydrogenase PdxA [Burkholderia mul
MTRVSTVALAIGDPNGIGPEIAVRAALAPSPARLVLFGDRHVIDWYARACAPQARARAVAIDALPPAEAGVIDVVDVPSLPRDAFSPGTIAAQAGTATLAYAAAAIDAARDGHADAVIACPHSETAIHASGVKFAGYPGFLAGRAGLPADDVYLMLVGGGLRIVHATLHEGIVPALARLSRHHVERAARAAVAALQRMGVARPVVGLMGINPHAGEGGLFGREDIEITEPVALALREDGIEVVGPQGADLLLGDARVDVFVAMYHDQGHIPVKLRAGRHCAALSLGAGVVFSSVGHGSGFDIAGRLCADPAPLTGAIRLVTTGMVASPEA